MRYATLLVVLGTLVPPVLFSQTAPTEEWQVCYGSTLAERPFAMVRMADGDLCIASQTNATGGTSGDVSGNHGGDDGWVIKLDDSDGSLLWQRCVGGSSEDDLYTAVATPDGGVLVAGESNSVDYDALGCVAGTKHWLVKLDPAGVVQWHSCGAIGHTPWAIALTSDGGCITTGRTWGIGDLTVDKFDSTGTVQWSETFGGSLYDHGFGIVETVDQPEVPVSVTTNHVAIIGHRAPAH